MEEPREVVGRRRKAEVPRAEPAVPRAKGEVRPWEGPEETPEALRGPAAPAREAVPVERFPRAEALAEVRLEAEAPGQPEELLGQAQAAQVRGARQEGWMAADPEARRAWMQRNLAMLLSSRLPLVSTLSPRWTPPARV